MFASTCRQLFNRSSIGRTTLLNRSSLACTRQSRSIFASAASFAPYYARSEGEVNSKSYRVFIHSAENESLIDESTKISPWFSIPLHPPKKKSKGIYHFVVEIPKGTQAKMESALDEEHHPIKQDLTSKGDLRILKHGPKLYNYGFIPQTWEDPREVFEELGYHGDSDPLDVIELSSTAAAIGDVKQVKVLGALAMIDDEETDWKILAIDIENPLSEQLNDIDDVEKHMPGAIHRIREWYRVYKVAEGKDENQFGFGGEALNKKKATEVINECHKFWERLREDFKANS